jgi:cytochrome c553
VQGKCLICHGADGEISSPAFPRLAGQNAGYVMHRLSDYMTGKRKSTMMQPMVEDLSPADFKALGELFAGKPTIGHAVEDTELAQVGKFIYQRGNPHTGVASCATCHGGDGDGTETLRNLRSHLDDDPKAQITVVTHAFGVNFLVEGPKDRNESPFAAAVAALANRGVTFETCEITLQNRT